MDDTAQQDLERMKADYLLLRYDGESEERYTDEEKETHIQEVKRILLD